LVAERNCRKKSEEQEHITTASSTIYGAQCVPTVFQIVVHALFMIQRWIPAFAESTPQKRPSYWREILGGIERKYSGGMTDQEMGSRLRGNDEDEGGGDKRRETTGASR
jgi:hypothetical protein